MKLFEIFESKRKLTEDQQVYKKAMALCESMIKILEAGDFDWEPHMDDYVISDTGALGSQYYVTQLDKTYNDYDQLIADIKKDMESSQFWPDVWYVNDHGNIAPVTFQTEANTELQVHEDDIKWEPQPEFTGLGTTAKSGEGESALKLAKQKKEVANLQRTWQLLSKLLMQAKEAGKPEYVNGIINKMKRIQAAGKKRGINLSGKTLGLGMK